jgi:hypothetical protein
MNSRNVTDEDGRAWACRQDDANPVKEGQDVNILCTTATVSVPVRLKVGWQWMKMAEKGLARIIAAAVPAR